MTFSALECESADISLLKEEYQKARQVGNTRLGERFFYFLDRRRVFYVPYEAIGRCFRRVELIPAKMCCGRGDLQVENLVLCARDERELAQIRLPGERAGKALLEEISRRAPQAQIGVKKPEGST